MLFLRGWIIFIRFASIVILVQPKAPVFFKLTYKTEVNARHAWSLHQTRSFACEAASTEKLREWGQKRKRLLMNKYLTGNYLKRQHISQSNLSITSVFHHINNISCKSHFHYRLSMSSYSCSSQFISVTPTANQRCITNPTFPFTSYAT